MWVRVHYGEGVRDGERQTERQLNKQRTKGPRGQG